MNDEWKMDLLVMPHSTGAGDAKDKEACEPLDRSFTFKAIDFNDAVEKARMLQRGVKSHDRVWEAPIMSLIKVRR